MRRFFSATAGVLVVLGCGGASPDMTALVELHGVLPQIHVGNLPKLFVQGGAEAGLVNARCAEQIRKIGQASPEMQQAFTARVLFDPGFLACPTSCAAPVMNQLVDAGREQATGLAVKTCGEGPFGGPLGPLRDRAEVLDLLITTMMTELALEAHPPMRDQVERLATGLAVRGLETPAATPTFTVEGDVPPGELCLDAVAVRACTGGTIANRVVFDPAGKVAGVSNDPECAALSGLSIGAGAWRVADLAWAPGPPVEGETGCVKGQAP